jgi:hypothetical protein
VAREGERRVNKKITFHDKINDQQPTNSFDKKGKKGLQRQKISFGRRPITYPTILRLQNNRKSAQIFTDAGYVEGYMASIGVWLSDGHPYDASRLLPPRIQDNNNVELEAASETKKIPFDSE